MGAPPQPRPRVVVESPLGAKTALERQRNLRYALWCCRAAVFAGYDPIASHIGAPWYLDDQVPDERMLGIGSAWLWQPDVSHLFFTDLGCSVGMQAASVRCRREGIPLNTLRLAMFDPSVWAAFQRGDWPPHTGGFAVGQRLVKPTKEPPYDDVFFEGVAALFGDDDGEFDDHEDS